MLIEMNQAQLFSALERRATEGTVSVISKNRSSGEVEPERIDRVSLRDLSEF